MWKTDYLNSQFKMSTPCKRKIRTTYIYTCIYMENNTPTTKYIYIKKNVTYRKTRMLVLLSGSIEKIKHSNKFLLKCAKSIMLYLIN